MIHDLFAKKTERPAYYTMFANLKQNCHYITNALKSEPDNLAAGTARSESDFFNSVPNLVHKSSFIPSGRFHISLHLRICFAALYNSEFMLGSYRNLDNN